MPEISDREAPGGGVVGLQAAVVSRLKTKHLQSENLKLIPNPTNPL